MQPRLLPDFLAAKRMRLYHFVLQSGRGSRSGNGERGFWMMVAACVSNRQQFCMPVWRKPFRPGDWLSVVSFVTFATFVGFEHSVGSRPGLRLSNCIKSRKIAAVHRTERIFFDGVSPGADRSP